MKTNKKRLTAIKQLKEQGTQLKERDPVTYWPTAFWAATAWISIGWMVMSMSQCVMHAKG